MLRYGYVDRRCHVREACAHVPSMRQESNTHTSSATLGSRQQSLFCGSVAHSCDVEATATRTKALRNRWNAVQRSEFKLVVWQTLTAKVTEFFPKMQTKISSSSQISCWVAVEIYCSTVYSYVCKWVCMCVSTQINETTCLVVIKIRRSILLAKILQVQW